MNPSWASAYLALTALTAVGAFLTAHHARPAAGQRPDRHTVAICALAGMLWPLLCLGAAQLAAIIAARHVAGRRRSPARPAPPTLLVSPVLR